MIESHLKKNNKIVMPLSNYNILKDVDRMQTIFYQGRKLLEIINVDCNLGQVWETLLDCNRIVTMEMIT